MPDPEIFVVGPDTGKWCSIRTVFGTWGFFACDAHLDEVMFALPDQPAVVRAMMPEEYLTCRDCARGKCVIYWDDGGARATYDLSVSPN